MLKQYDSRYVSIFQQVFDTDYKKRFHDNGISFESRESDFMVAYAIKSRGGFVWACKNADGDTNSDLVA